MCLYQTFFRPCEKNSKQNKAKKCQTPLPPNTHFYTPPLPYPLRNYLMDAPIHFYMLLYAFICFSYAFIRFHTLFICFPTLSYTLFYAFKCFYVLFMHFQTLLICFHKHSNAKKQNVPSPSPSTYTNI